MRVYILEERQRGDPWAGDWADDITQHGVFSSQEAAIRWLRKSRQHWGDREPLMPIQHPGGISLANGRYWVSVHDVDPEPITAWQWDECMDGGAIGSSGERAIPMPPQAEREQP